MLILLELLNSWKTGDFEKELKNEIESMSVLQLPLQQGLSASSYALDTNIKAVIMSVSSDENIISVKAAIFYSGIIAGCSCADDPGPVDEQAEHCEIQLDIDKLTAETKISLIRV